MTNRNKRAVALSTRLDEATVAFVKDEMARVSPTDGVEHNVIMGSVMSAYAMAIARMLAVKGNHRADVTDEIAAFGRMLEYSIEMWRDQYRLQQAEKEPPLMQIVTASEIPQ